MDASQPDTDSTLSIESLQQTKLMLEVQKLKTDVNLSASEGEAKLDKLRLEVLDLKRWSWTKPGTMIPVLATMATIIFAQYQGVFEIQTKRLDLEAKELVARNRELTDQQKRLASDVETLRKEQGAVVVEKQSLVAERTSLRVEVEGVRSTLTQLQKSEADAKSRALALEERFARLYSRIREIARVEIVSAINDRCGRAEGAPSVLSLLREPTSPESLARDKETADRIFASDPLQCYRNALENSKISSELTDDDRSYLVERVSTLLSDLSKKRVQAMTAYAKYSSLAASDLKPPELPEPSGPAVAFRPKNLDEAAEFAWKVRYAKVSEALRYNFAHTEVKTALSKIQWPPVKR